MQPILMESAVTPRVSPVPFVPISGSLLTTSMMLEELAAVVDELFDGLAFFLLLLPHALAANPMTKSTASGRMSLVFISPLGVLGANCRGMRRPRLHRAGSPRVFPRR